MKTDFLAEVLQNPLRARILRVLVHSMETPLSVVELAKRSASTARTVKRELKLLDKSQIVAMSVNLVSVPGTQKRTREERWTLNMKSPHMTAFVQFVSTVEPVRHERIVETLKKAGRISVVVISGTFLGDTARSVDLILGLESVHESQVDRAVRTLEAEWGREIRYAVFPTAELRYRLTVQDKLLRDVLDFPHKILLDKMAILGRT